MADTIIDTIKNASSMAEACNGIEDIFSLPGNFEDRVSNLFPWLLDQIFGFGRVSTRSKRRFIDYPEGWIRLASESDHESDRAALVSLLWPSSNFFQELVALEAKNDFKLYFPVEYLPKYVQRLISSQEGLNLLCQMEPEYTSRLKSKGLKHGFQVFLKPLEYFLFCFSRYLSRHFGNFEDEHTPIFSPSEKNSRSGSQETNPYKKLIKAYMDFFLRHSHSSPKHADLFFSTIGSFWFIYDDDPPYSLRDSLPPRKFHTSLRRVPSDFFFDCISLLPQNPALFSSPALLPSLHYKLYRFLVRSFQNFPKSDPKSLPKASRLVSFWLSLLSPWSAKSPNSSAAKADAYSPAFKAFVVENYILYNSVSCHFLSLCLRDFLADKAAVLSLVLTVVEFFSSSKDLASLLTSLQSQYLNVLHGNESRLSNFDPSITLAALRIHRKIMALTGDGCELGARPRNILKSTQMPLQRLPVLRFFSPLEDGGASMLSTLLTEATFEVAKSNYPDPSLRALLARLADASAVLFPSLLSLKQHIRSTLASLEKPTELLNALGNKAVPLQSGPKSNLIVDFSDWVAHSTAGLARVTSKQYGGVSVDFPLLEVVVGLGFFSVAIIGFFLSPLIFGT